MAAASAEVCTGQCCAVFPLSIPTEHLAEACENPEHAFVADMLIPLTVAGAVERLNELSMTVPLWIADEGDLFACKHWDAAANRCREYAQRPGFCRTYPQPTASICQYCGFEPPWPWFRS